ncbi:hypothetical protein BC941DRAFT_469415 [Chlamydoabsidia padenii]|nr:hypothetical protein BC941DRAFT_469415 [Chlamydoabsidia padenii]
MSLESGQIKLSIHLQPDFGWTIENEPAFGPGSILQGQVDMEILDPSLIAKMDRLRIVFHGSEGSRSIVTRSELRRRQFFGVQRTLWEKSKHPTLSLFTKYTHTFTLQLPFIQFPPTIRADMYRCCFKLSVFLDGSSLAPIEREIMYRPFLETCLFKTPLVKTLAPEVTVSTHALDYVPGDTLVVKLLLSSLSCIYTLVQMDLVQVLVSGDQTDQHEINSLHQPILSSQQQQQPMQLTLMIPATTAPSFSYSDIASVSYKLILRLKEKKKSGISNLLASSSKISLELPIHIGTLGYGIRSSEGLKVYSTFQTHFDSISIPPRPPLPLPRFVPTIEYEESLPLYDPDQLPTYYDAISTASECDSIPSATTA